MARSWIEIKPEQRVTSAFAAPLGPAAASRRRALQIRVKRGLDVTVALLIIILAAPLLLLISLAILVDSGAPVLFRQQRHGRGGAIFSIYKFRTMYRDSADGRQVARGDPRITRIGSFLRRSSLDELPQVINVLLGDMSLVGPRPHPVWLDAHYRRDVPNYADRFAMRPGITGLAQISGCRGATASPQAMSRRVDFDVEYIERWSLLLDLKILAITAALIWTDGGAF